MFILMHHSCLRYFDLKAETVAETLNVIFTVEDILVRTMLDFFVLICVKRFQRALKMFAIITGSLQVKLIHLCNL